MSSQLELAQIGELKQLVCDALAEARACGASAAEADASVRRGLSDTVRLGKVETIQYQRDRGLSLTVYIGRAKGAASTTDLRPEAMREAVRRTVSVARYTADDDCAGLADAGGMARDPPDLDLYHPWGIGPEEAVALARQCEAAGLALDARLRNSEGATVSTHGALQVYGNTHGFLQGVPSTRHSVSCALLAQHQGDMQRDHWYSMARRRQDLEAMHVIGRRAGERALRRLGARRLGTRRAPVLLGPELARGLLGHFVGAVRGASQYRRASFLLGAAGTQVFPPFLSIAERPHLPRGLASRAFDDEGVATRDRELVREGVLGGYVLGSYAARKLGLSTTGNAGGVHNLVVSDGASAHGAPAGSCEELLRLAGRGLYVNELMGPGVNGITGDYSRGASGFWFEGGAIAYPVHELTIAGDLRQMLRGILAVGTDVDVRGAIRTGSILLEAMTIGGE